MHGKQLTVELRPRSMGGYWLLAHDETDEFTPYPIKWPVYRLELGDVNQDKKPDALIGVIKETPYDSVMRRRLFIYTVEENHWKPLWLGSRVSQPLVDFHLFPKGGEMLVKTIEKEQNGLYLLAEYRFGNFGLNFSQYLERDLTQSEARKQLQP